MAGLDEAAEAFGAPPEFEQFDAISRHILSAGRSSNPLPQLRECIDLLTKAQGDAYTAALIAAIEKGALDAIGGQMEVLTDFFHAAAQVGEARAMIRMLDMHITIVAARQEAAGSA